MQARGSKDAHNTSKRVSTRRTNVLVLLVLALMLMSSENLLLWSRALTWAKVRLLVLLYREGMEPEKGNYQICACQRTYACVEGVLTSVMLILIVVLVPYKKSKLRRSSLVRISYVSEYLLPPDLFLWIKKVQNVQWHARAIESFANFPRRCTKPWEIKKNVFFPQKLFKTHKNRKINCLFNLI